MSRLLREHGTLAMYRRGGCTCTACRDAGRRYARRNTKMRALGTVALIPADTARRHVRKLLAAGLTVHQIEARSGIHRTAIRVLIGDFPNRAPSQRIRPATAAALLSIRSATQIPVGVATVDATGTRRLHALLAAGYPAGDLARRLGSGPTSPLQIARTGRVRADTARAVRALYAELEHTAGPSNRARRYYRAQGYLPPAWWDNDTIDDPTSTPAGLVQLGVTVLDDLTRPRRARAADMARRGVTAATIAAKLDIPVRYVHRDLAATGTPLRSPRRVDADLRDCAGCARPIRPRHRADLADVAVSETAAGLCYRCVSTRSSTWAAALTEVDAAERNHLTANGLTQDDITGRLAPPPRQYRRRLPA